MSFTIKNLNIKIIVLVGLLTLVPASSNFAQKSDPKFLEVPEALAKLIVKHSEEMFKKGYYEDISEKDYYHGHLVLRKNYYESPYELLSDWDLILYHTHENDARWESQKDRDPEKRTQRSIVGSKDGNVRPAIEIIKKEDLNFPGIYEEKGSIYPYNISGMSYIMRNKFSYLDKLGQKQWFYNEFRIASDPQGKFVIDGQRYNIYFLD